MQQEIVIGTTLAVVLLLLSLTGKTKQSDVMPQGHHAGRMISFLVACEDELLNFPKKLREHINESTYMEIVITGVGKINAAIKTAECIFRNRHGTHEIVNVGTAGSHVFPKGTLGLITKTGERDFDATDIMRAFVPDYPKHLVPFEEEVFQGCESGHDNLKFPDGDNIVTGATCWTGDNTHAYTEISETMTGEFIEMEAAAIVKTANYYRPNAPKFIFKWASDGAGEDVGAEWKENHAIPPHIWQQVFEFLHMNRVISGFYDFESIEDVRAWFDE